ncbi:DUF3240 family protein [Allochromatium palmeri]|uniref:DUF3240 domain-containing protein n=1 Tax=Allochromatium palmeri TaxID=231048 RepID=A0A6N8ED43_9GAMM|nr:DUF3240 family protein [Allochromatium palmeri]MTW20526.1 DUF3240 domain-containing protein [Allochromatium palmeri]
MSDSLLNLIVPPHTEDLLAEWLLEREDVPGFTSLPVSGHGSSESSMSLAEQVAGRSRRVLFMIHLPLPVAETLLAALAEEFRGGDLHYWLVPALKAGRINT